MASAARRVRGGLYIWLRGAVRWDRLGMITSHEPPMSTEQAAEYLGTTKRHVDRLAQEHRVPYLKLGGKRRFLAEDLAAFLRASRVEPRDDFGL